LIINIIPALHIAIVTKLYKLNILADAPDELNQENNHNGSMIGVHDLQYYADDGFHHGYDVLQDGYELMTTALKAML